MSNEGRNKDLVAVQEACNVFDHRKGSTVFDHQSFAGDRRKEPTVGDRQNFAGDHRKVDYVSLGTAEHLVMGWVSVKEPRNGQQQEQHHQQQQEQDQ